MEVKTSRDFCSKIARGTQFRVDKELLHIAQCNQSYIENELECETPLEYLKRKVKVMFQRELSKVLLRSNEIGLGISVRTASCFKSIFEAVPSWTVGALQKFRSHGRQSFDLAWTGAGRNSKFWGRSFQTRKIVSLRASNFKFQNLKLPKLWLQGGRS